AATLLKASTTPTVTVTEVMDYFDLTGSNLNPSGYDPSNPRNINATVSVSAGVATVVLGTEVKKATIEFLDTAGVLQTVIATQHNRGEWGSGLAFKSARNIRVENLTSTNMAGDGMNFGTVSHHTGYNCDGIYMENTTIDSCRRQGIS